MTETTTRTRADWIKIIKTLLLSEKSFNETGNPAAAQTYGDKARALMAKYSITEDEAMGRTYSTSSAGNPNWQSEDNWWTRWQREEAARRAQSNQSSAHRDERSSSWDDSTRKSSADKARERRRANTQARKEQAWSEYGDQVWGTRSKNLTPENWASMGYYQGKKGRVWAQCPEAPEHLRREWYRGFELGLKKWRERTGQA